MVAEHFGSRLKLTALAAAVVMCITASIPPMSLFWLNQAQAERHHVDDQLSVLLRVQSLLVDAETGQRGYVITGRDEFLEPFNAAIAALPEALDLLRAQYADESAQERAMIEELLRNAGARLEVLRTTVDTRRTRGFAAVEPVVSSGKGKHYMDEVRRVTERLQSAKLSKLHALDEALRDKAVASIALSVISTLLTAAVLLYGLRLMMRTMADRDRSARELATTSRQLEAGNAALTARNQQVSLLSEMSRVLQTEMGLAETLEITAAFCGRLLTATRGNVYLFRNSADLLEPAAHWGFGGDPGAGSFEPGACWGIRRGNLHQCNGRDGIACKHYDIAHSNEVHICLPLTAYGEVLGLMHLEFQGDEESKSSEFIALLQTIAEQVALALSNAKLRQVLRDQSIKDPLTGLFNRRYMEETLDRELARAQRDQSALSVIMADLDHFKQINDRHGHQTGDVVLKETAEYLMHRVRASDVACRLGGEEFALILPNCPLPLAMKKAQELCDGLRALSFQNGGAIIKATASFGVAGFPEHSRDGRELLGYADTALYAAKAAGRNQVKLAANAD